MGVQEEGMGVEEDLSTTRRPKAHLARLCFFFFRSARFFYFFTPTAGQI